MVLVSILGDFHSSILPIFFEFKDKLTHHIILHDDSKYDKYQAKKLIKAQNNFIEFYKDDRSIDYELINITIDEDNYDDILKAYKSIIKKTDNPKDIYLNATDGLSSVVIVLSNKILEYGGNVIVYDKHANSYNIHTKGSMKKKIIKNNMDIKNHLKLKGYELKNWTNKFELKNRKEQVLKLAQDLQRYKKFAKGYPLNVSYKYQDLLDIFNSIENISDSERVFFANGVLFEEYIYHLIKDNFNFDEVMTGVLVEFEKDLVNEFDILMIKNNHLHTIECKFVNRLDGEHYVYKTDSIIDYLDDDGKAMILSIGSKDEKFITRKQKKDKQFTQGDLIRAANNNIKIHHRETFNKKKFLNEVREWFCTN